MPPARVRAAHAARLEQAFRAAIAGARRQLAARDETVAEGERGFYLEFEIPIEHQAALDGLENRPQKIELVAVRPPGEGDEVVTATVFVPEAAADYFSAKVEQYRAEDTPGGKPRNENLVARIDGVRLAAVRSLFTDSAELFPPSGRAVWWEVWVRDGRLVTLRRVAARVGAEVKEHVVRFPERDVVLVLADSDTIGKLIENSDAVAELRAAKDTPSFFLGMQPLEQADWAGELVDRVAQCFCDAGLVRRRAMGAVGSAARAGVRRRRQHSGLHGMGRAAVCGDRQLARAQDRQAADRS